MRTCCDVVLDAANDEDARFCKSCGATVCDASTLAQRPLWLDCASCADGVCLRSPLGAQFQMPDPKQMSGIPRPVDDLPDGSDLGARDPRRPVEQHRRTIPSSCTSATRCRRSKTDDDGRAQFDKLPAGRDGEGHRRRRRRAARVAGIPGAGAGRHPPDARGDRQGKAARGDAARCRRPIIGTGRASAASRASSIEPGDEAVEVYLPARHREHARACR